MPIGGGAALARVDGLVPGGTLDALIAPASIPLELALGAAWSDDVRVSGDATVTGAPLVTVLAAARRAAARYGSPLALHAGARWLGERYAIEAGASAWLYPNATRGWQLDLVRVIHRPDDVEATITYVPTRFQLASRVSARAAVDVEVVPGWLWLTGGYAYTAIDADRTATTTITADPGGHPAALGLEISTGTATITLGVARRLDRMLTVAAPGLPLDNPFAGGTAPANRGHHAHSRDQLAIALELAFP